MAIELIPTKPEHIPELARIAFEAFKGIQDRHNFPLDIPTIDVATMVMGMFASRPDIHGITALRDGNIVGSNFVQISDAVAGIGPITVDASCQGQGVGRLLMEDIIEWSRANHGPMIRLVQETYNNASLSLYTSLGFNVVEPLVLMEVMPAASEDATVRQLTMDDLPACEALAQTIIKVSRTTELTFIVDHGQAAGFKLFGRFKGGKLVAYAVPGFLGHSVGETVDDLLTTVTQGARQVPPSELRLFVPTRNGDLFRSALKLKFRCLKPMTLMAMGPYEEPMGPTSGAAWTPSIAY